MADPGSLAWPQIDEVIERNRREVLRTGETHFLRDPGAVASALGRVRGICHYQDIEDLAVLAAYLVLAIGQNHPFEQADKRTVCRTAELFLRLNGYDVEFPDYEQDVVADVVVNAVVGDNSAFDDLCSLFAYLCAQESAAKDPQ